MFSFLKKRWEIYFTPLCHHDYGYTKPIEPLLDDYVRFYRDVIRFIELTDAYPEEAKYRYTCEEMWSVAHFLECCNAEEKAKFIKYAREGRIEISAFWANIAETQCSGEELIRMMYYAFELKSRYGIPVYGGSLVDMPGMGWGVPKVMAGAGLEYLFNGMPAYFHWRVHGSPAVHEFWDESKILRHGRPDAYIWEGQDGGSIFTYYQGSYGWFLGATPPSVEAPETLEETERYLPDILRDAESRNVPFNILRFVDHGVDNRAPEMSISDIARRWNEKYDNPRLIVSTNDQFFMRLKRECGVQGQKNGSLRSFRGEIPHTDYTYAAMSFAKEMGLNYRNHNAAAQAEFLSTLAAVCLRRPGQSAYIMSIYKDMMTFDEHCFGMSFPVGAIQDYDWSSKAHHAYRAAAQAKGIGSRSASDLAAAVAGGYEGDDAVVTVFNSLGFERTDIVRIKNIQVDENYILTDTESGAEIPYTVYKTGLWNDTEAYAAESEICTRMGGREADFAKILVFRAERVPPLGWKSYKLNARPEKSAALAPQTGVIENDYYRVTFAVSGQIASVFDKALGKELVDTDSPHPFAAVLCRDCESTRVTLPEYSGFEIVSSTAVMQKAIVRFRAEGVPEAALGIILYQGIRRIEFELKLLLNGLPAHEWLLALPFDIPGPAFEYEGAQCRPTPFRDQFPGSLTNHYTVQNWASAGNSVVKAAISSIESHVFYFGGLWPCYVSQAHHAIHPKDFGAPFICEGDIGKGGMYLLLAYNNGRVNFHMSQNGEVRYTFALTSGEPGFDPVRFGQEFQNKLIAAQALSNPSISLGRSFSAAECDAENVQVSAFKCAEDGNGYILRLMETTGSDVCTALCLRGIEAETVIKTSLTEENGPPLPVQGDMISLVFKPFETITLRIIPLQK